jgi:hypothetical protein
MGSGIVEISPSPFSFYTLYRSCNSPAQPTYRVIRDNTLRQPVCQHLTYEEQ